MKFNFGIFNLVEGLNPLWKLRYIQQKLTPLYGLKYFSLIFLKTLWVYTGSYMRWSKFILLTERGNVVTLAIWKMAANMAGSATEDVRVLLVQMG